MADEPFNYSGKLAFLRRVCVDPRLQRTAVAVAAVLIDYADKVTGVTYPSVARIVAESGVPKSTALRALRRLEETGWLTSTKRNGAQTRYVLTGVTTGTGASVGAGANWNATGAIQNLRAGRTGPDRGTEAVPTVAPEQEVLKATGVEQGADATRPVDLWTDGKQFLVDAGTRRESAGHTIGKLRKVVGEDEARTIVGQLLTTRPTGPNAYVWGIINARLKKPKGGGLLPRDSRSEDEQARANEAALARLGGGVR